MLGPFILFGIAVLVLLWGVYRSATPSELVVDQAAQNPGQRGPARIVIPQRAPIVQGATA